MIQAKCIQKFRDKNNNIYGYRLQDQNGACIDVRREQLKQAIKSKQINIINLTLTSDNRLVDTTPKQNTSSNSPKQNIMIGTTGEDTLKTDKLTLRGIWEEGEYFDQCASKEYVTIYHFKVNAKLTDEQVKAIKNDIEEKYYARLFLNDNNLYEEFVQYDVEYDEDVDPEEDPYSGIDIDDIYYKNGILDIRFTDGKYI